MIGRLRGTLLEKDEEEALVECGGVGYIVRCGVRTIAALPAVDAEVTLHIESQTREDGTRLYGFLNTDDRRAFNILLGVQGVGPKAALSVLDVLTPDQLAQAVAHEDKTAVGRANGVGPKLALRILTELKGKSLAGSGFMPATGATITPIKPSIHAEAVAALIGLGIADMQARLAVDTAVKTLGADAELPILIRASLKALGK